MINEWVCGSIGMGCLSGTKQGDPLADFFSPFFFLSFWLVYCFTYIPIHRFFPSRGVFLCVVSCFLGRMNHFLIFISSELFWIFFHLKMPQHSPTVPTSQKTQYYEPYPQYWYRAFNMQLLPPFKAVKCFRSKIHHLGGKLFGFEIQHWWDTGLSVAGDPPI